MIENPIKLVIIIDKKLPVLGFVSSSDPWGLILLMLLLLLLLILNLPIPFSLGLLLQYARNDTTFKMSNYSFKIGCL